MRLSNGKFNPENEKKMKTINYFSIAFAGLAMFCACTKAEIGDNSQANDGGKVELVTGEGQIVCTTPPMTKTAIGAQNSDGSYPVVWLDKDQVKVYGENFTEGVVHTASVTEAATSAIFYAPSTEESVTDQTRYAVYPAAMAGTMTAGGITVDLTKLREQEYHSNIPNFGQYDKYPRPESMTDMTDKEYYESATIFPHLPLWAKAENGSSDFTFSNLMGVVKLALNDYQGNGLLIKSAKMTAKTPISGTMTVAADGAVSVAGADEDANTVTIVSNSGVKISDSTPSLGDAGVPFYFFIPVGTYEGFDFEFTTTDGRIFRKSTANTVVVEAGIVKKYPLLNFTLFYGNANCYLLPAGKTATIDITPYYSFDMTFNGSPVEYEEGVTVPSFKAKVEWDIQREGKNLNGGVIKSDESDISVAGNVLTVKTNYQGSALVSIRQDAGEQETPILWSYHIWTINENTGSTDDHFVTDLTYIVGSESFQMMSHALGATRGKVTDASSAHEVYGMYYQWGRKEPLPAYGTKTYSDGVTALFSSEHKTDATICDALNNPLIAYKTQPASSTQGVVFTQTGKNNSLWGAPAGYSDLSIGAIQTKVEGCVKTVYDPCPKGYMIPQGWHFSGLTISNAKRQGYGAILKYDGVNECYYAIPGVFPVNVDVVSEVTSTSQFNKNQKTGNAGRYHVSTAYGTGAWASSYFNVYFDDSSMSLSYNYGAEANACSVRCMKIPSNE